MSTPPSPAQIQQTTGALFDGFVLSMIGYGFTFFQTYIYFSQYPSDHWRLKAFVGMIFAIDTASAALLSKAIWFYIIEDLPYIVGFVQIYSSLGVHILLSAITIFGVQLCYSLRLWQLGRNAWMIGLNVCLSIAAFSFGIAMVVMLLSDSSVTHLASTPFRVVFSLACAFIVLAYLLIFIGLTQLSPKKIAQTPISMSGHFDAIIRNLFARGLLVTVIQFICFVVLLSLPHHIYWLPIYLAGTKVAINSLLHMLNSRKSVRGKGINDEDLDTTNSSSHYGTSRSGQSTNTPQFAAMFKPSESAAIEITRTIELDQTLDEDSESTKVYGASHGSYNDDVKIHP